MNPLTALLRVNDLGLDALRFAKRKSELEPDIKINSARITELVEISEAARLLQQTGFGPVTAAVCLTAPTKAGYDRRPPSPPWPGSIRSRHLPATPSGTDSTAAATEP